MIFYLPLKNGQMTFMVLIRLLYMLELSKVNIVYM